MGITVDWLGAVGEIRQLARAYYGDARDEDGKPSEELLAYLRYCAREGSFVRPAVAVRQIRDLIEENEDPQEFVEITDALPLPTPTGGKSTTEWLRIVADTLEGVVESHAFPPTGPPMARFEWITYYPSLATIISSAYHQDSFELHGSLENALAVTIHGHSAPELARAIGQVYEILAWHLSQQELIKGFGFMGLQVATPIQDAKEFLLNIRLLCESEIEVRLRQGGSSS
jgi:hypothetical protein